MPEFWHNYCLIFSIHHMLLISMISFDLGSRTNCPNLSNFRELSKISKRVIYFLKKFLKQNGPLQKERRINNLDHLILINIIYF